MIPTASHCYGTDVFAHRTRRTICTHSGNQYTDVFASRERRTAAAISESTPHRIRLELSAGREPIERAYFTSTLPPWLEQVLGTLPERWGSTPGWDGYNAVPTDLKLVVELLNVLSAVMPEGSSTPQITPLADGGAQAEWHRAGLDLEIVAAAGSEASYYFSNQTTGEEEEQKVRQHETRLRSLIVALS